MFPTLKIRRALMPKSFDELTFADDWMFQKVMTDPQICAELVERLLHIRVDHVEFPELRLHNQVLQAE